tara:strand:- start:9006 stop:10733 length:1728 start_codon:yes stop_codon:yes gene_type:complete
VANHVVCTAGHVDHGKSTLIHALTGTDPDRWVEEKERGLTIDLGFAQFTLPSGNTVSFIDVPGHERFIRNMLAGVGTVDSCIFVIAANEGWKPQSEEHLRILDLLGVSSGIVVLTKIDIADQELCDLAELEVIDHLEGTFLSAAPIVRVDALSGKGMENLVTEIDSVLGATPSNPDSRRPRLWVDRVFAAKGSGTVVTGTLGGGSFEVGEELLLSPNNQYVRIRALQSHHEELEVAIQGARVAVNLTGVDHNDLSRGSVLTRSKQWYLTSKFDADLSVLNALDHDVSRRGAYLVYLGSGEYPAKLRVLGPKSISPGGQGKVRIFIEDELPLMLGDRYILRDSGRGETIGGGVILDAQPLLKSSSANPDSDINRIISEHGWISVDHLEALTGVRQSATVKDWIVHPPLIDELKSEVLQLIEDGGALGVNLSALSQNQRNIVDLLSNVHLEGNYVRKVGEDSLADHEFLTELEMNLFRPPEPVSITQPELRELVRRGLVIEEGGIYFSPKAIEEATIVLTKMFLKKDPEGITVGEIREELKTTRKYVLPLLAHLDNSGITVRRGDVRLPGKRMTSID